MYLKLLATDLDGTIAQKDQVSDQVWKMLESARENGYQIILVTGRTMKALRAIRPFEEICEAIVAENGALVFFPRSRVEYLPFGQLDPEIVRRLKESGIPLEVGRSIAATWEPYDEVVSRIITDMRYAATIEFNKGAVMVMPQGATKGSGLMVALHELGYSRHHLIAFGDAENDRSFFEQAELSVAVENAAAEIKELANICLPKPDGIGVSAFIESLLEGKVPSFRSKEEDFIRFGESPDGTIRQLHPFNLLNRNLCIVGSSGSGKSWLAGHLVEQLLQKEYQVCIIDPEGDYRSIRAFPHTLLLGGAAEPPPPVETVITLMEYANLSTIVDLSLCPVPKQVPYVENLLRALFQLHKKNGKPQWILMDEAHYFLQDSNSPLSRLVLDNLDYGGLGLITYRLGQIPPEIRDKIPNWMITNVKLPEEIQAIRKGLTRKYPDRDLDLDVISELKKGQALLSLDPEFVPGSWPQLVEYGKVRRAVPHIRHLHKYLYAPLPSHRQFYFHIDKKSYQGPLTASNLWEFGELIPRLPMETLEYHMERRDFERWLTDVVHDRILARRMRRISRRQPVGEALRQDMEEVVQGRLEELQKLV
jgi:hypothetical protein